MVSYHNILGSMNKKQKESVFTKIFDLNLPPKEDTNQGSSSKAKRMKYQKDTKGKKILKFGLSDDGTSDSEKSEAGSSQNTTLIDPGTQGTSQQKLKSQGAADQQPSVEK